MTNDWQGVLNVLYIFIFMFIAKLMKEKLGIFKSIIIPTALLAGFLGLLFGPVLGLIEYNIVLYEKIVFHFMGIGFITLTLSEKRTKQQADSVRSGLFIISTYCFQGVIGLAIVFLMILTFKPDLFVGLGLMLPLAFGQGPGFASSIGSSWNELLPFGYVNQYGLTLATTGFLVGGLIGVIMLNYYARRYNLNIRKLNTLKGLQYKEMKFTSMKELNFSDLLTVQIVCVAIVYLGTYFVIYGLTSGLELLGNLGHTVAGLVKGFNFLFGILLALLFKVILKLLAKRGHRTNELVDSYLMHNLSSFAFNVMITASVMAISIQAIKDYWELLLGVTVGGTILTLIYIVWFAKKAFKEHTRHYTLAMFGMLTGTASTGMALLRGIDPDLETPVAKSFVLGSAVAAPLGIPLMLLLGVPIIGYTENNPSLYYITFIVLFLYMSLMMGLLMFKNRKYSKSKGK